MLQIFLLIAVAVQAYFTIKFYRLFRILKIKNDKTLLEIIKDPSDQVKNIIEEFKLFGYPQWLRDFVGIQKIAFSLMLFNQDVFIVKFGALGISLLMLCALLTHFKIKNPFPKMLPSSLLLISNVIIFFKS